MTVARLGWLFECMAGMVEFNSVTGIYNSSDDYEWNPHN